VAHELAIRWPTTIKLAVMAIIIEIIIGISAGVLAGIRRGKFSDTLVTVSTLVLISIPVFVIGNLAQLIFGVRLGWFPVTATHGTFYELIMPAFVLASLSVAYVARLMRANLVENLRADYVRTARAKGLSNARTVGVHTLRNSLIPVITYIGIDLGALMGGAIVTERIFNINGVGNFLYRSINQKDGVAVVGTITMLVLVFLFANLIVDILYGVLDPRISND
jgi:oligopeptide transport system permease protein